MPAGAKAQVYFQPFAARLKSCSVTKLLSFPIRPSVFAASGVLFAVLLGLSGCRSYHVETTVENRTGAAIQLLEVDYPSASFGADSVAAGADFHYRLQIRGEGPVKVQYTGVGGRQEKMDGPTLAERQEGSLEIVLLPGGKAEFHPQLSPGR